MSHSGRMSLGTGYSVMGTRDTTLSGGPRVTSKRHVEGRGTNIAIVGAGAEEYGMVAEASRYSSRKVDHVGGYDSIGAQDGPMNAYQYPGSSSPRVAPPSPSGASKGRPVKRYSHGPGGADSVVLGQEHVVYTCGVKEAQMRTALEPSLRAAALTSPTAGGRPAVVAMLDRERAVPKGPVGGPDHLSTVWTDNLPVPAESLAEAQRRVVFDPSAREDVVKQPEAGRRVEPKWLGESIRTTKPTGGDQHVQLAWPEAQVPHAVPQHRRLSGANAQSFAPMSDSPAGYAPRSRDSMGAILGAGSSEAVEPTTAAIQKRKLLYPDQPLAGKGAKYLPGLDPARQGVLDAPGTQLPEPWSAPSPRGPPASSMGSLLSQGDSAEASGAPRGSRLQREQPLGGRGMLSGGIPSLDAPAPARGAISQITF